MKAQDWLDQNYPKERRNKIKEIYLNEPSLEGELDLGDFTYYYGVNVLISPTIDASKLVIKNQRGEVREAMRTKLVNAQESINQEYPNKEDRAKITELNINGKYLEGDLDLSDFINLKVLDCLGNKLTSLNINNCSQLEEIYCPWNKLTSLDLSNCSHLTELDCGWNLLTDIPLIKNLTNLRKLDLNDNNFPAQDLSWLAPATNLESLLLGSYDEEKINQNIYNRFKGSLEPLKNMTKLKILDISNTDIDSGLEYLPDSLEKFKCYYNEHEKPDMKVKIIVEELRKCGKPDDAINFFNLLKTWKETNKTVYRQTEISSSSTKQKTKLTQAELTNLQKEHSFYKSFFDNHFQSKQTELAELKNKLSTREEQESLTTYLINQGNSSAKKLLNKTKKSLLKKLTQEELNTLLNKQTEINELEKQLSNLQIQEAKIQVSPKGNN